MIPSLPESDLLAFIEGELPADRLAQVQAAIRADAELRRLVEGLQQDRAMIRASLDRAATSAPRDIVSEALAEAERRPAPASERPRAAPAAPRLRIGPVLSLAAAAAVVVLALVVFWPTPKPNDRFAAAPSGPPAPGEVFSATRDGPGYVFEAAPKRSKDAAEAPLPDVLRRGDDRPVEFAGVPAPPPAQSAVRTREQAARDAARDREIARIFGLPNDRAAAPADFDRQLADAGRNGWRAGFEVGGMDLGRAAELAMTRRLRIVVESSDLATIRTRAGFSVARGPDGSVLAGSGAGVEAVSVSFPMDPQMEGLQNALARVAESIEADGDAVVRFEEVPEGQELADAALIVPSTEADDVLWWRLPSDRWMISSSVSVPIEFIEPEVTDP